MYKPYLEEVVLEEISHGLVRRNGPPRIHVNVEDIKPQHKQECTQLGLIADSHQGHQQTSNYNLEYLLARRVRSEGIPKIFMCHF